MRVMTSPFLRSALLTSTLVASALFFGGGRAAALTAGAGRADIVLPPALFPIDGFVGQHDPLMARVLLLDDGTTRVDIVSVDLTSMSEETVAAAKAILGQAAGVTADNVVVCASHTFSAPHAMGPPNATPAVKDQKAAVAGAIETALRAAAAGAAASAGPARVEGSAMVVR